MHCSSIPGGVNEVASETHLDALCCCPATGKDCGAPPAQPNTIFDLSGGTKLGDTIKVTCEEG